MKKSVAFTLPFVLASALTTASAFTLNGTVFDESGNPVSGALVKLIVKGDSAQTDKDGKFSIHEDEEVSLRSGNFTPGHISVSDGVLRYAQSSNTPVQVSIFDATGNQVLRQELLGSGQVDLRQGVTKVPILQKSVSVAPSRQCNSPQTANSSTAPSAKTEATRHC